MSKKDLAGGLGAENDSHYGVLAKSPNKKLYAKQAQVDIGPQCITGEIWVFYIKCQHFMQDHAAVV